jgi:hypothetical protein
MRERLNLADPRLRGIVGWWPLQGDAMPRHLAAPMGARSALTLPAGASFGAIPGGYGISLSGAASTTFSTVTATALGVSGATSRTLLLEFIHKGDGNTTTQWLWGAGIASVANQLFGVMMNLFGSHMLINCYGSGDFFFNVKPTTDDALVRLAVTYDPDAAGGTLTYYYRTLPLAGASAGIWSEGSGAKTGVALATAGSGPVTLGYRQEGNFAATNAQIAYVLSIGGVAWTANEARETLRYPDKLWQPTTPVALAGSLTQAWVEAMAETIAAGDLLTAAQAASVAATEVTTPADAVLGALAAALIAADAATPADALAGSLAAAASLADDATPADAALATLLAFVAIVSAVSPADALAGSLAAAASLADAATPADAALATLLASVAIVSAVSPADAVAASVNAAQNVFFDTVLEASVPSDTLAVSLAGAETLLQAVTPADTLTAQLAAALLAAGTVAAADAMAASLAVQTALVEALAPADILSARLIASASVADGAALDFIVTLADQVVAVRVRASLTLSPAVGTVLTLRPAVGANLTFT